jgi:prepilin-type N-terminal cleavage/methylation domain-containing protein
VNQERHVKKIQTKQSGFTLVEIAIVLVIIGLLLGSVLKGQELIYNQKIKATYALYRQYTAAMYGYQDRYQALPGDDGSATSRGFMPAATDPAIVNGNANGWIDGGGTCTSASDGPTAEVCQANYHMRLAGFLTGDGTVSPTHSFGGTVILVRSDAIVGGWSSPTSVCWEWLTNRAAQQIDSTYDDGQATSGSMRGNANYTAAFTTTPDGLSASWSCMTN